MVLSYSLFLSDWFRAEPLLLESGAGIAAALRPLALNQHNPSGPPQYEADLLR
jgi:hypothetical protein